MTEKLNIQANFKDYIMENVVKGYQMEFEDINAEMLDSLITKCQETKARLKAAESSPIDRAFSLFKILQAIVNDKTIDWDDKYRIIFSDNLSKKIFELLPDLEHCDPDSSYEDDVLAFYRAVKAKLDE